MGNSDSNAAWLRSGRSGASLAAWKPPRVLTGNGTSRWVYGTSVAGRWQPHYFGINTVSMTWIAPFDAAMSVFTTLAASTMTLPPAAFTAIDPP